MELHYFVHIVTRANLNRLLMKVPIQMWRKPETAIFISTTNSEKQCQTITAFRGRQQCRKSLRKTHIGFKSRF